MKLSMPVLSVCLTLFAVADAAYGQRTETSESPAATTSSAKASRSVTGRAAGVEDPLVLWYRKPASIWTDA